MPRVSYKPFPNVHLLSQDKVEKVRNIIIDSWNSLKVKPHQFLPLGNVIIFQHNAVELAEQVSVETKEPKAKKLKKDVPEEIIKKIEQLKIEYDLTQKEISQLYRQMKQKEVKKLEIEKRIEILKSEASKLGDIRHYKRIKDRFNKAYNIFFSILNSELNDLPQVDKNELTSKLEVMNAVIKDTMESLKQNLK